MSATAHGSRAGTKTTKATKITKTAWLFVIFVAFVLAREPWAVEPSAVSQQPPPTQAQQRPVFRAGTHFVRVDAYPSENGKIIEGLTAADFQVLEDGKPQAIDSFDYVRFDTFTPEAERRNPSSQRDGFELAADPRYRVFVIFVDMGFSDSIGVFEPFPDVARVEQPLVDFIDRVIGVHDLFGLLSSRNTVKDLVLGQKTGVTKQQVRDLWRASFMDFDPTQRYDTRYDPDCVACRETGQPGRRTCNILREALKARYHADQTYTLLRALIAQLGAIREERKNIVFVSNQLARWRGDVEMSDRLHPGQPQMGIDQGRITRGDPNRSSVIDDTCAADVTRLPLMDFENRFQQVLTEARRANVAFYVIPPSGLQAPGNLTGVRLLETANEGLREIARETDGLAVIDSNDLQGGLKRIADDLEAYYVLGYYTTNTKFDGKVRQITVKLRGSPIRARREYRAPTQAEIAALASKAAAPPPASDGPPAVIGEPIAYRVSRGQPLELVTRLEFERSERLRVTWTVLAPLDRREARVLDSTGKPLPIELPLSENENHTLVTVELPLAPFARGVYSIELTAGSGQATERRRVTFAIK